MLSLSPKRSRAEVVVSQVEVAKKVVAEISNFKCVVKIRSEYSRLSISCVCRKCNRKSNFKIKFLILEQN